MSLGASFFNRTVKEGDAKRMSGQKDPDGVVETNDIPYLNDGHKYHLLDIYKPQGANGVLPVIVDIHGGGWVYGDKELNKKYCLHLASRGFAVVNISYRLCPEVTYVGSLQDICAALNWVADNAEKYGLDGNNAFITGDSAGGHYCGLVLALQNSDKLKKLFGCDCRLKIKAVGFTCAAFNPSKLAKIPGAGAAMFNDVYGKGYKHGKNKELLEAGDFCANVPDKMCPSYIISAYGDFLKGQCDEVYKLLTEKGVDCEYKYFDAPLSDGNKLQHVYNVIEPWWDASVQANDGMCAFFRKYIS